VFCCLDVTAQSYSLIIRLVLLKQVETLVTISIEGKITDMNEATIKITGGRRASYRFWLFWLFYWASNGRKVYQRYSQKDLLLIHHLLFVTKENWQMFCLTDPFIKMIKECLGNRYCKISQTKRNWNRIMKLKYLRNSQELPKKKNKCWKCRCNCWKCCKSKTTILSNMSHEIRTPMNAIMDSQRY
jgi:hypothetical protein